MRGRCCADETTIYVLGGERGSVVGCCGTDFLGDGRWLSVRLPCCCAGSQGGRTTLPSAVDGCLHLLSHPVLDVTVPNIRLARRHLPQASPLCSTLGRVSCAVSPTQLPSPPHHSAPQEILTYRVLRSHHVQPMSLLDIRVWFVTLPCGLRSGMGHGMIVHPQPRLTSARSRLLT